jgi:predicted DNA binding protein
VATLVVIALGMIAVPAYDVAEDVLVQNDLLILTLLENSIPFAMATAVCVAAIFILRDEGRPEDLDVILRWTLVGLGGAALTVLWTLGFQILQGKIKPAFVVGYSTMWGGMAGLLVGIYDIRRRRRKDELKRVNELNAELRQVNTALATASTREGVEQELCERLTNVEQFRYAWIGELDGEEVVNRASSGIDTDDVEPVLADGGGTLQAEAVRENELSVREPEEDRAVGSVVAVPIVYDEMPYGVLTVGIGRGYELEPFKREALLDLGRHVGDAINAIKSRKALVADTVVELAFELSGDDLLITRVTDEVGGRLVLRSSQYSEGSIVAFYDTIDVDHATIREVGESCDWITEVNTIVEDGDGDRDGNGRVQVTAEDVTFYKRIVDHGGRLTDARAEDGIGELEIRVPRSADVRQIVTTVREECPSAELVSRKDVSEPIRDDSESEIRSMESLTSRQLLVAKTAYHGGYFETPRKRSGEELAASLDVSAPTFHDHLRAAERELFGTVFDGSEPDDGTAD